MGVPGRKSFTEELKIAQRYSVLSDEFFRLLAKFLKSKNKQDQKWAGEQLSKAFIKMIPQTLAGDEENPIKVQITGMKIIQEDKQDKSNDPA